MIFQDPRSGHDCNLLKAMRIQQPARHLSASNSVLGGDPRILGKVDFNTPLRIHTQQQTRRY
jgi:hypothetical protein